MWPRTQLQSSASGSLPFFTGASEARNSASSNKSSSGSRKMVFRLAGQSPSAETICSKTSAASLAREVFFQTL